MPNRLSTETSPYLLQHATNPVDWFPWGDDALDEALRRDVPILLSIGYAACHWCHVMERESFEDPAVAELMNANFVSVKVDREERPDIDAVYMEAVQAMTGHGGWPMTVFLTPEGAPFFGGTYFPPQDRHGLPGFSKLLLAISEAWKQRRAEVEGQGRKLIDHMGSLLKLTASQEEIPASLLKDAVAQLAATYDPTHGGFGGAPKFPQPMIVDLLLRLSKDDGAAAEMARTTLDSMAAGGMYDQLGGGFARYSVDASWTVPHFEKMLYDNAQLLRTYARAHLVFGSERYRNVARSTAAWMLSEMRDQTGGFYSSLDADSEGVEGLYYVWSIDEVNRAAGSDAQAVIEHYGMTPDGNFEGKNIPVYTGPPSDPAAIERGTEALLQARRKRVPPATDTKVLSAWNGLAISALAESGASLGEPDWIAAASQAMRAILDLSRIDGRLMRSYRDGVVKHLGFAEDYAFVLEGCLALFEATGEPQWLEEACWAADSAIELFLDHEKGGFFTTGNDAERLVIRNKELLDNAVPAANSVFAMELQRLAALTGDRSYEEVAAGILSAVAKLAAQNPLAFGHLLGAVDLYHSEGLEIVIVGAASDELVAEVHDRFLPNSVLIVAREAGANYSPLLEGRGPIDGRAAAYVCVRGVCDRPVTDPQALASRLG